MGDSGWDESAELYAGLSPKISFYQISSKKLVSASNLETASTVVDVGCGSACLSIREILNDYENVKSIIGVDSSPSMIKVASRNVFSDYPNDSHRIKFICNNAEELGDVITEQSIDRAICTSALGMFDLDGALKAIRHILKDEQGQFVFNLAEWDYIFGGVGALQARYVAIDKELEKRGLPKKETHGAQNKLSKEQIDAIMTRNGFSLQWYEEYTISVPPQDWSLFYLFPTVIRKSLSYLPFEIAKDVLHSAMETFRDDYNSDFNWVTFRYLSESALRQRPKTRQRVVPHIA